ncbi:GIN domain-containing protein [Pedobacter foliorum]|uniref:GIN domain-containing protein n=1 Tax=Pedobacter foliorum TaxID=2739058 RepID=UPI001563EEA3|nr:DUF2807 domain-containing protein [Pedobacter foliorum]NRF41665.1 DUF2807 domain-containing protein [Pedobacter foliorum]
MKTLAKTIFASALTVIFLASTAITTFASDIDKKVVESVAPMTFNKVKVSGNVKVLLVQSKRENIEVINGEYNQDKTSIKRLGYTLVINSTEASQITVLVSVSDLQRIDVSGSAVVKTDSKFNVKYLQVFLKDDAKAIVKANTESMYTYIKDNADLKLSGTTADHTLVKDDISKLDTDQLVALKTTTTPFNEVMVAANKKIK